jgi:hypothetical protein
MVMRSDQLFKRKWIAPGLPGVRDGTSTYDAFDFESLPSVPVPEDLGWLIPLEPELDERLAIYRPDPEERQRFAENWRRIVTQAERAGIHLPTTFTRLMESEALQDRIPSCTACYFELPAGIERSPFRDEDRVVRFLNDQQGCCCWYLYLPENEDPFVICSALFYDELDEMADSTSIEEARQATTYVAQMFEEFIYRFWLENSIWFSLTGKKPLTPEQLAYVRHYAPNYQE